MTYQLSDSLSSAETTTTWHQRLDLIRNALAATARHHDETGEFPHANFALLQHHGLLALLVPRQYGGSGGNLEDARHVISAVARGEPSTALILVMQYVQHALIDLPGYWPDSLKRQVFEGAVERGELINALRVEPELGTPMRGGEPSTSAQRVGDGWIINGSKIYSTGIEGLTWLSVWAKGEERCGAWLVHRDSPGITLVRDWNALGFRASGSHKVVFDNVWVPLEHAVDLHRDADANGYPDYVHLWMQTLVASLYDAIARNARDWFVDWARQRVPSNLGHSLARLPNFQVALGEVEGWLLINQRLIESSETMQGHEFGLLKHLVTSNTLRVIERLMELSGNHGLSRENPLQRYYRDALCGRVHSPQTDTALATAGRHAFERDR